MEAKVLHKDTDLNCFSCIKSSLQDIRSQVRNPSARCECNNMKINTAESKKQRVTLSFHPGFKYPSVEKQKSSTRGRDKGLNPDLIFETQCQSYYSKTWAWTRTYGLCLHPQNPPPPIPTSIIRLNLSVPCDWVEKIPFSPPNRQHTADKKQTPAPEDYDEKVNTDWVPLWWVSTGYRRGP